MVGMSYIIYIDGLKQFLRLHFINAIILECILFILLMGLGLLYGNLIYFLVLGMVFKWCFVLVDKRGFINR